MPQEEEQQRKNQRSTALLSEKLPPIVVGKYAKPGCLETVLALLHKYSHDINVWITHELFKIFLKLLDPKMHAAKMDVLLFINKCL